MKEMIIEGATGRSTIRIGGSLNDLADMMPTKNSVIVTDDNVWNLYRDRFPDVAVIKIGTGEKIKTMKTLGAIYERLVELEADRDTFMVAIGGGIVCDVAGFAASTYMRGIRYGFVASTLLAQVDASVGGKNGVNFQGYKNMVGVFNQPRFVICDLDLLRTLPKREILCGLAEVVKHAAIADQNFFEYLFSRAAEALKADRDVMQRAVHDSVVIKSAIVNADEKEKGERRKFNFGHTFGHAVEKVTGLPHGEAVGFGMAVAANMSVAEGLLDQAEADRLLDLLNRLHLPTRLDVAPELLLDALKKDKKRHGDGVAFVLIEAIGKAVVRQMSFKKIKSLFSVFCGQEIR